jgi:hypothetical protein
LNPVTIFREMGIIYAKKLVLRYEAKNKIDTTTFCTPQFSLGSVKVKKGRKKKK